MGLGNVGGKLAGSLQRNGFELVVRDLDATAMAPFLNAGASTAASGAELGEQCDVVITCLPTPEASAAVLEAPDGVLAGFAAATADSSGPKIWAEMSTTDHHEVQRLGVDPQGHDELLGHGQSRFGVRSTGDLTRCRHGPRHRV